MQPDENLFYRNLSSVPELPADLFDGVTHRIRKKNLIKRSIVSAVVSLLFLTSGYMGVMQVRSSQGRMVAEAADELQILWDYVNPDSLDDRYQTCTLYLPD